MMEKAELIELVGRRWSILDKLRQKRYYTSELAKELAKKLPEISMNLKELENSGLVQREQGEGRRKYYRASNLANRVLAAVTQAIEPKPEEKLEKWKLDELLNILEDENLSEDLRQSYSDVFYRVCNEHPHTLIRHKEVQELFEKAAADTTSSKFERNLMRSLSALLPQALVEENWRNWVAKSLYPILVKKIEDKKVGDETRLRAVARIGQIASLGPDALVKREAENKLLETWFANDIEVESNLGNELRQQLTCLCSKRLFEQVKTRAKELDKNTRAKAEVLLKQFKECLLPQSTTDSTEGQYEVHNEK